MKILITGTAGFIGFHLSLQMASRDCEIVCLDNLNNYYDTRLKLDRLRELGFPTEQIQYNSLLNAHAFGNLKFIKLDLEDKENLSELFRRHRFDYVINLAAQAGVRYSLQNPGAYIGSNIVGFFNLLESCRLTPPKHLIFASSSSVYGLNRRVPFSEQDNVDHPVSLYAATKKSNELMAHSYSHLFRIPTTGLRFFTVYGPWGRPDMAYYTFTRKILKGEPLDLYNFGNMKRDFTYIDDIIEGIIRLIEKVPPSSDHRNDSNLPPDTSTAPYRIYNIGNNSPVPLEEFISILEELLGRKAVRKYLELQPGDVVETYAQVDNLMNEIGFKPSTQLKEGLRKFVEWYARYHA